MYIFFLLVHICANSLSLSPSPRRAHTRTQFIEVDELDIRIYFTVLIKWGAKFIYTQRTAHNDSVADADIFTNIYLKSILYGGWFTSVHITRTSSSLSLFGFIRFVSKRRDSHSTLDGHTSHSNFGLYISRQRVRAYACYMSDKIVCVAPKKRRKMFRKMVACIIFSFSPRRRDE